MTTIDTELEESLARARPSLRTFGRLLRFVRPYWRLAAAALSVELVFVVLWSLGPLFLKVAIDDFIQPAWSAQTARAGVAHAAETSAPAGILGVPSWAWLGIGSLAGLMVLNLVFQAMLSATQQLWVWRTSQSSLNDLRKFLFGHIQELSMDFFDRQKQGTIIARVDRDVEYLEDMITEFPLMAVQAVASIFVVGFWLLSYDWRLCGLVAVLAPIGIAAAWASNHWGLPAYRRVRRSISRMTANLAENVTGVMVVQAFGREERNLGLYRTLLGEFKQHTLAGALVRGVTFPGMMLVFGLIHAAVIAYAAWALPRGYLTIGEIPATIIYIGMIYGPIMMLGQLYDQLLAASAAAERVVQLMDRKPAILDRPDAPDMPPIRGAVAFDHVFLKYDAQPNTPWILNDVSFAAEAGDIVALVGPTGAGKTLIVNLIPRFYQPQQGRILIDGRDIRDFTLQSLHRQMGIVLQENFLFTGTVMDNLKYGRPAATDDEAVAAAQAMGIHPMIEKLAKGYQTDVRERGGAISHGERQLICFTRALIANPRILILDEATSSVDTETEMLIQQALWRLMEGRTTFVVAHRLSTIRHATRILVIEGGRITESGTHDELMTLGNSYAAMFEQFVRQA